jgi:hypothetical protein
MNLDEGNHTFLVRAIDTSHNIQTEPQQFSWTIIPLSDAIVNLRDFVSTIILPNNLKTNYVESLNNALGNIENDGNYDHLICEYLDAFAYRFSTATVLDAFNQDVTNFVDNSFTTIRDRTGCNPPIISLENEIIVDEGLNRISLDASGSFDSKDGRNLDYQWEQIAGLTLNLYDSDKSRAFFDTPILDGNSNQIAFFKVKVTDQNDLSSEKVIKVIIRNLQPVNQPPVAERQSVTANTADPTAITLKATDPQGNPLTYSIVSDPKSGTISDFNEETGTLTYTSNDGFTGQDRFTFKANDGTLDSNTAHVVVKVSNAEAPVEPDTTGGSSDDDSTTASSTPPASDDDDSTTASSKTKGKPASNGSVLPGNPLSTTSNNSTSLFGDAFPGLADNMKNLFGK